MKRILMSTAALAFIAGPALAETSGTINTDVNLRSGPGVIYAVDSVVPGGASVTVEGCASDADTQWCRVNYEGREGWVYGRYLDAPYGVEALTPTLQPEPQVTEVVVKSKEDVSGAAGGAFGLSAAAMLGAGPAGLALAAISGAALAEATKPGPEVVAYVNSNPVEPAALTGNLKVGNRIPERVILHPIPDSDLTYLSVDGVPVIVEPGDRKIITIVR